LAGPEKVEVSAEKNSENETNSIVVSWEQLTTVGDNIKVWL